MLLLDTGEAVAFGDNRVGQCAIYLKRATMLGLIQLSNYLTLKGSFSAVSKLNLASKFAFESARRDLHNALLCTVLQSQFFRQKSPKNFAIELMNIH